MKVLATIDVAPSASFEAIREGLHEELQHSWQLFAAGVLREAYATDSPSRVVFVMESDGIEAAAETLRAMPLIAGGLLVFDLVELRPFANWSRLFAAAERPAGGDATPSV